MAKQPKWELFALVVVVVAGLIAVALDAYYRTPTEAAAIATAWALVVIAYQSWQTRAAAAAAERGLIAADRSIAVTQALAAEAEKARLEQRAPMLRLLCSPAEWPPSSKERLTDLEAGRYQEGQIFRMPGDAGKPIVLRAAAKLRNEGGRTVHVTVQNALAQRTNFADAGKEIISVWEPIRPGGYSQMLAPNDELPLIVQELHPASDWVENAKARQRGEPGKVAILAEIIADDGFDNGVIDNLYLELGGFPLEPVAGETDSWQIPACLPYNVPLHFTAPAQLRRYYRSKRANQELPDVQVAIQSPKKG